MSFRTQLWTDPGSHRATLAAIAQAESQPYTPAPNERRLAAVQITTAVTKYTDTLCSGRSRGDMATRESSESVVVGSVRIIHFLKLFNEPLF